MYRETDGRQRRGTPGVVRLPFLSSEVTQRRISGREAALQWEWGHCRTKYGTGGFSASEVGPPRERVLSHMHRPALRQVLSCVFCFSVVAVRPQAAGAGALGCSSESRGAFVRWRVLPSGHAVAHAGGSEMASVCEDTLPVSDPALTKLNQVCSRDVCCCSHMHGQEGGDHDCTASQSWNVQRCMLRLM